MFQCGRRKINKTFNENAVQSANGEKKQFTSALHDHCSNIIRNLDVAAHLHVMT